MPSMEIEDAAGHRVRGFREKPDDAARFAVVCKEGDVRHFIESRGRTDKSERHFPVRFRWTFTQKEIDVVRFRRVLMFLPRGEDRETAIETLRASSAMGMKDRHVVDTGAAPSVPDQITAPVHGYPFDDFRLRHPSERVVYVKGAIENPAKHATKARQRLWMCCSGCLSADDLGDRWQVEADNAILEEGNAVLIKQPRRYRPECRKQKGSRSVRRLPAEVSRH